MVTGSVNAGVFDSALGDLVLRVRGTKHDGQLLRLRSPKCTIGSGPNCTLRLHGRSISGVHCLILRGPNGQNIRSWSPDTLLNGRPFTEAPLAIGDCLNIGALQFEIVQTGESPAQSPDADQSAHQYPQPASTSEFQTGLPRQSEQLEALQHEYRRKEEALQEREKQLENASAALTAERDQFEQDRRQFDQLHRRADLQDDSLSAEARQIDARRDQLRQDEQSLQARAAQLETDAAKLRAEQEQFLDQRRCFEQSRDASLAEQSLRAATAEKEQIEQLKSQSDELQSHRQALASEQQQWQAEQDLIKQKLQDSQERLNDRAAQLDALAAELDSRKSQLDAQSAAFQSKTSEFTGRAAGLDSQTAANAARAAELDARGAQLDAKTAHLQQQEDQIARLSAQLDARTAELDKITAQSQSRSAELQSQSEALDSRAAELDQKQSQLGARQSELDTRRSELDSAQAKLDLKLTELKSHLSRLEAERKQLDTDRGQWEESRSLQEQSLAPREEAIEQKSARLESQEALLRAEKVEWQQQLAQRQGELEAWEAKLTQLKHDATPSAPAAPPARHGGLSTAADKPQADSRDALTRPQTDSPERDHTRPAAAEREKAPAHSQPDNAHEEESVNSYMARLMERIRTTQGELGIGKGDANQPALKQDSPPPPETAPDPQPAHLSATPQSRSPVELQPHTVAPEKLADITLLRDLANYSAQTALGVYDRRLMTRAMYSKLAVAVVGGAAGIGLLAAWRFWYTNSLTFYTAIVSLLVAVVWGVQYVLLTARLLVSGTDTIDSIPASQPKATRKETGDENDPASLSGESVAHGLEPAAEQNAAPQPFGGKSARP